MENISEILQAYHYPGACALLLLAGFGAPFPEDIVLVVSGYIASTTNDPLIYSILVCFAGVLMGDAIMYGIGRRFGDDVLNSRYFRLILSRRKQRKIQRLLVKYGNRVVFIARFTPGIRAPIFAICGGMKVPFRVFICWDGLAGIISIPLFCYAGYRWGEPVLESIEHVKSIVIWVLAGTAALTLLFKIGYNIWDHKDAKKREPQP